MELILIRHGETEYNRKKQLCGITDIPLNRKGIRQMINLRNKIQSADIVYCSTLTRAKQSAKILFPEKKINYVSDLNELDFGDWEGLTYKEIIKTNSKLSLIYIKNPYKFCSSTGESLKQLEKRVMNFINKIISNKMNENKKIICITHGGPIKVILCHLLLNNINYFWNIRIKPGATVYLKFKRKELILFKK